MHIHGIQPNLNGYGTGSAAAAEKAAASQRAADVRRKLLKVVQNGDGELSDEGDFMMGRWLEQDSYRQQGTK